MDFIIFFLVARKTMIVHCGAPGFFVQVRTASKLKRSAQEQEPYRGQKPPQGQNQARRAVAVAATPVRRSRHQACPDDLAACTVLIAFCATNIFVLREFISIALF